MSRKWHTMFFIKAVHPNHGYSGAISGGLNLLQKCLIKALRLIPNFFGATSLDQNGLW